MCCNWFHSLAMQDPRRAHSSWQRSMSDNNPKIQAELSARRQDKAQTPPQNWAAANEPPKQHKIKCLQMTDWMQSNVICGLPAMSKLKTWDCYPKGPAVLKTLRDNELLRNSVFTPQSSPPPVLAMLRTLLWEKRCLHVKPRKLMSA